MGLRKLTWREYEKGLLHVLCKYCVIRQIKPATLYYNPKRSLQIDRRQKPVGFLSWWCAPWHVSRTKSTTERIAGLLIKLSARTWSPTTRLSIYTAPIGPNLHREVLKWGFRHIKPHRFSAKGNVEAFSESWGSEHAVMSRNSSRWVRQTFRFRAAGRKINRLLVCYRHIQHYNNLSK